MYYYDPYNELLYQRTRDALNDLSRRAREEALAWEVATGEYRPFPGELSPPPRTEESNQTYYRLLRLTAPIGPQILRIRLSGAVADVQWSGDGVIDQRLADLDLYQLAAAGFTQALVTGIVAYMASTGPQGAYVSRLGGYLEPYTDPDDVDRITGLLQAWQTNDARKTTWNVRVYDFTEQAVREWRGLEDPAKAFLREPDQEYSSAIQPHVAVTYRGADGLPIGEFRQGLNLIRAHYAIQLRIQRVAEMYGFPTPVLTGAANIPEAWAPGIALTIPQGDLKYVFPPGLSDLFEVHQRSLESLREFFSLPGGSFGSGHAPSGEALKEGNRKFTQISTYYARLLSQTLTKAVKDYATLIGLSEAPAVDVASHDMGRSEQLLATVVQLYSQGVIPLEAAARVAQSYIPGWSDEELREWVESQRGLATPQAVARLLGGAGATPNPDNNPTPPNPETESENP